FQEFKVLYTDILFVLATCSLVFHVLNIIYPSLLDVFPIHYNEGGYPFRFCILSVTTTPEFSLIRNWGIFREPGVYIFYLNLGLVFELFSDRINFKKVICFLIAIVTTLSTAGFIVAAGVISSFLIFSKHANRKQRWTFFTIILIGTIYVVTSGYFDSIYGMVFGKLFYENDSTASRTGSFVTNINMWLQNFGTIILGQGYTFVENEFSKYQSLAIGGENNTNTVFKMLAVHGIVYTSIIYGLTYRFCAKKYGYLGYLILLFILMLQSNEDLTVSFHTYLLAFYALEKSRFLVKNV
ncbi:O-antigen ligase family protein, partial [Prevotella sp. P4-119]|uniref:O-antigen ligase family protein n=1 Tax=Prevotella sp. P4-119 TaxID=2024218 RepID=UPI000BC6FE9D